jgi:hypothetical protein
MRHAGNFNPEWGYLAPAPGFMRTLRMMLVAAAVGASAGGAVVFSLVGPSQGETSVAARTLVESADSGSRREPAAEALPSLAPAREAMQTPRRVAHLVGQPGSVAAAESGTTTTVQGPATVAALAEAPVINDAPTSLSNDVPLPKAAPVERKVAQRHTVPRTDLAYQLFGGPKGPLMLLPSFSSRAFSANSLWGQY